MGRIRSCAVAALLLLGAVRGESPVRAQGGELPQVPGATWDERGYEDRILGFRLERPPYPWKPSPWNKDWAGPLQAVATYKDPTGALLEVHALDPSGQSVEDGAIRLAQALELKAPAVAGIRPVQVGDDPAVVCESSGSGGKKPVRARLVVLEKDGVLFGLVAWADGRERLGELSKTLLDRFRFLDDGEFRRRERRVEVGGPGWRASDGIAEHAFVGVRVGLGPGWGVGQEEKVDPLLSVPTLSLECPGLETEVRFRAVPREDQSWNSLESMVESDFDRRYKPIKGSDSVPFPVQGRPAAFKWRVARGVPFGPAETKQYAFCGTVRGDERLILVEILHPGLPDPRVTVAVRELLARTHVLTAEERMTLIPALAAQPDFQFFVGRDEFVRDGAYTNFSHRIVWKKPSANWSFLPRRALPNPEYTLASLRDEERATAVQLQFHVPDSTASKWDLHESIMRGLAAIGFARTSGKPVPVTLGTRDAVRSEFRVVSGFIRLRGIMVTTNPIARKFYAVIAVTREQPEWEVPLKEAISGLRFQMEEIVGPRKTARGWIDPAFGFAVEVPTGTFKLEAPSGDLAASGGTVVSLQAGDDRIVVAAREWPTGAPAVEKSAVARVLALLDPEGSAARRFDAAPDAPGTLGGRPSQDRVCSGSPSIRVSRVRRGGILYVVAVSCATPESQPAASAWFRFE